MVDDRKKRDAFFFKFAELTARLNYNKKILVQTETNAKKKF